MFCLDAIHNCLHLSSNLSFIEFSQLFLSTLSWGQISMSFACVFGVFACYILLSLKESLCLWLSGTLHKLYPSSAALLLSQMAFLENDLAKRFIINWTDLLRQNWGKTWFSFWKPKQKQILPLKNTVEEVLFEWLHRNISFTGAKDMINPLSIIYYCLSSQILFFSYVTLTRHKI